MVRHTQLPRNLKRIRHNKQFFVGWDNEGKPIWNEFGVEFESAEADEIGIKLREMGIHKLCFHGIAL